MGPFLTEVCGVSRFFGRQANTQAGKSFVDIWQASLCIVFGFHFQHILCLVAATVVGDGIIWS